MKSVNAAGNMPVGRLVDDETARRPSVLVKADARPGHPLGGEGRRQGRWPSPVPFDV